MTGPGDDDRLVPLGAVARPHGLTGEVRVKPFNPETPVLREVGRRVHLRAPDAPATDPGTPRDIARVREGADVLLIQFSGVQGRDEAEALRGLEVCVPRSAFPPLGTDEEDDEEIYLVDLVGLPVRQGDVDEATVGTVAEILDYPSVACLRVVGAEEEWEVPNLERYVVRMDLEAGVVTVAHLDELPSRRRRPKNR